MTAPLDDPLPRPAGHTDRPAPDTLDLACGIRRAEHQGRYRWTLPTGWAQGRGAWGGAVVGAAVRAVVDEVADVVAAGQRVRSVSAQLVGAVPPGERDLDVVVLRRGSGTTTVAVRVTGPPAGEGGAATGEDTLLAHVVAVLGRSRAADLDTSGWVTEAPPEVLAAGWRGVPVIPVGPPVAPEFVAQLEFRPLAGIPYAGGDETLGWVRPAVPPCRGSDDYVAAVVDAWWTAVMPLLPVARPVATLSYALEMGVDPVTLPLDEHGRVAPLLHRARVRWVDQAHAVETRELWTEDGRLAAWNSQTVVIIR